MKKLILTLFASVLVGLVCFAQPGGVPVSKSESDWSSKDRADFIGECIRTASEGMSKDSAKHYCYCMQERIEDQYPKIADAGKLTEADVQTPEWKVIIQACINAFWTATEREEFVSACIGTATPNIGEEKAKVYCDCMLYKVQKRFPNFNDTNQLTDEKLKSPEWRKIIESCLAF